MNYFHKFVGWNKLFIDNVFHSYANLVIVDQSMIQIVSFRQTAFSYWKNLRV